MRTCAALLATLLLTLPASVAHAGGPQDAVLAVAADMAKVPVELRPVTRWLYLGHLPAAAKQEQWQVISGHVNSLSTARRILRPTVVLATQAGGKLALQDVDGLLVKPADWPRAVLIRVQTDYYGENWKSWERMVSPHFHANIVASKFEKRKVKKVIQQEYGHWERRGTGQRVEAAVAKASPDFHIWITTSTKAEEIEVEVLVPVKPDGKAVKAASPILPAKEWLEIVTATGSEIPVCYADWFVWQTMMQSDRNPGYYDFLGIKDRTTFNNLVGFDKELFEKQFKAFVLESRWAVAMSGVSAQPRRIAVFDKIGSEAGIWFTFDNRLAVGERNPLNTAGDEFKHDAEEVFATLPNGMWAVGLFSDKGERQDSAPDFIGHDKTSTENRARIEIGISCWRCHTNGGLQDLKDYFGRVYQPPVSVTDPDYKKIKKVQEAYFGRVEDAIAPGRARYTRALWQATGLTPEKYAAAIKTRWFEYSDRGIDFKRACADVGLSPDVVRPRLRAYCATPGNGQTAMSLWYRQENEKDTIPIDQYHELFGTFAAVANGQFPAVK